MSDLPLNDILEKGYFPRELPPPLSTEDFGNIVGTDDELPSPLDNSFQPTWPAPYSLSKRGNLRRKLVLVNPVSFVGLAEEICKSWDEITDHIDECDFSLSAPKPEPGETRSIIRRETFRALPVHQAHMRTTGRYLVKTDISNCYGSIYSHSIPWAIHGKSTAKKQMHNDNLLGNRIDTLLRKGQDRQSIGIPIGPDTSAIICEVVLTEIDKRILEDFGGNGYRYVDDYEMAFPSRSTAEQFLAKLEKWLLEYELELNPRKTDIIELPSPLEERWVQELRHTKIRSGKSDQLYDIRRVYDLAFSYAKKFPREPVLKYTASRMQREEVHEEHWSLYESFLLHSIAVEPDSIRKVAEEFEHYRSKGYSLDTSRIYKALGQTILRHARVGHSSEVAWAIWMCRVLEIKIEGEVAQVIREMSDGVVQLMALYARERGLFEDGAWNIILSDEPLAEKEWLLVYECNRRGWLESRVDDFVSGSPHFSYLESEGVSFYRTQEADSYAEEVESRRDSTRPSIYDDLQAALGVLGRQIDY